MGLSSLPRTVQIANSCHSFPFSPEFSESISHSSILLSSNIPMASAAISLNPDAPSFVSSGRSTDPSATLLSPLPNPNTYLSSYPYPFYLQIHHTQHGTSTLCADPPPKYLFYQYVSFPTYYPTFQLVSPSCAPAHPPSVLRCSIEELDDNLGTEKSNFDDAMVVTKPTTGALEVSWRTRASRSEHTVLRASRCQEPRRRSSMQVPHRLYEISEDSDFHNGEKTTLMIKNIPSKFSKGKLISILRDHCIDENRKVCISEGDEAVLSEFDYFYLPIDFRTNSNFGYAFVNFTSPIGAWRLFKYLHNHCWISAGSNKVCKVNFARIQGLAESLEHADKVVFKPGVPDNFLPVHFQPPYNGLNESVEYLHGRILQGRD